MTTKNLWMKCYISDVDCVDCPYKEQCNISIAALKLFKEKEQTEDF